MNDGDEAPALLCSDCFADEGLRIDALKHGLEQDSECPNCKSREGRKLTAKHVEGVAWRFFVGGTTVRAAYGGAPRVQFNEYHFGKSDISPSPWLASDMKLLEDAARVGFFHYGPRLWMLGEIEPLKDLQDSAKRPRVIERVLQEFPEATLAKDSTFYRLRTFPQHPANPEEYDVIDRHIPATSDRHLPATQSSAEGRLARPFCEVYFAAFSGLFEASFFAAGGTFGSR